MLLVALSAVACDNGNSTAVASTTTTTTAPTATLITESFTGTVAVSGTDFHNFTVATTGAINVTLTAAGPPSTIFMGIGVGTPSATACALLTGGSTAQQAGVTPQISGMITAGSYCVSVFDIGNQSAPVTYSVTVTHF